MIHSDSTQTTWTIAGPHGSPSLAPTDPTGLHGSHRFSQIAPTLLSHMHYVCPLKAFTGPHGLPWYTWTVLWITLAYVGATGPLSHPWPSLDFTSHQTTLAHSDSTGLPSLAHHNSTSQACSPSQHNWGMGQPRPVYMGICYYRTSHCFAFVIVMLLCICYSTSSLFVFSLLLLCPTLPVSKRA